MTQRSTGGENTVCLDRENLQSLVDALAARGYSVLGPAIRDSAIVIAELKAIDQLPAGWTDEQSAGSYRLLRRNDQALFGFRVGPQSWKKSLLPSALTLWKAQRDESGFPTARADEDPPKMAFLGVRPCELHAISIQDRVLMGGNCIDSSYRSRRENVAIVAANCTEPGGTCFCASMGTGPRAADGYDIALTEVLEGERQIFIANAGSRLGTEILSEIPHSEPQAEDLATVEEKLAVAMNRMGRTMDTSDIKNLLYRNAEHPRWEETGARCLSCANCTMVCPTCFCTTVEDSTDLSGTQALRRRVWDSCFTLDFSYVHGGSVRTTTKARYRQWLTHKMASWIDQFGRSGCVGCGRCITWCPVGIDITEEVAAIRTAAASPALEAAVPTGG